MLNWLLRVYHIVTLSHSYGQPANLLLLLLLALLSQPYMVAKLESVLHSFPGRVATLTGQQEMRY